MLERGEGGVMRGKKQNKEISKLGKLIRYSSASEPISQAAS